MRSRCVDTDEMKDGITEGCGVDSLAKKQWRQPFLTRSPAKVGACVTLMWCDGYCKIWVGRVATAEIDNASRRCCDLPGVADEGWSAVGWERHWTIVLLGSNNREEWSYVEEQCWRCGCRGGSSDGGNQMQVPTKGCGGR
ncbi:hypothetical protein B296_00006377 [Ensete ventricosum]|uniref:Uncharacterized protein n=1 Tax=Ensete ventricosum TaxID=4639 RepID=A0A426YLA4_ENSVE|nr:hypothetical protein B296_00006377 [Ensete ventricosum]